MRSFAADHANELPLCYRQQILSVVKPLVLGIHLQRALQRRESSCSALRGA